MIEFSLTETFKELQTIADKAVNGLIMFSLGTNMHSQEFGESIIKNILASFEIFPEYTFFWKIDLENVNIRLPNNLVIRKWFPQNDILGNFRQIFYRSFIATFELNL